MRYSHIVFDIDGTLLNSEYAGLKSLQDTLLEETGRLYPLEELTFSLGITGADALRRLGVKEIDRVWARWEGHVKEYLDTLSVYPGISEVVAELERRGLCLGIGTSRTQREYDQEALPLLPFAGAFGTVVLATHTARHKPHPEPLLHYMERSGAAAGEMLYLGDTIDDSRCAQGAGVDFALAGWGSHGEIPAKYVLKTPEELLACLD